MCWDDTTSPGDWVTQQARNLLMDLEARARRLRLPLRDRDRKFTTAFEAVFLAEGIRVPRTPVRAPAGQRLRAPVGAHRSA
jgi:putative transposase